MDEILQRFAKIEERLAALERRFSVSSPGLSLQGATPAPPAYRKDIGLPPPIPRPAPASDGISAPIPKRDVESYIGRWWLGIAGVIAIFFGASFFLKYAFENNLIGPVGRVLIEVTAGLFFVIAGELLRKKMPKYAALVTGTGLGLFYLAVYGAQHWYGFLSPAGALGFMSAVTGFGVVLALMTDAAELAGIAVLGGFLTPFLIASQTPQDFTFFAYLLVLSVGILAISFFKKWHQFILLGFCGMVFNFISWFSAYYMADKLWFTVTILAAFYLIYLFATLATSVAARQKSRMADLALLTLNATWFFGWCYYLLKPEYESTLGFFAAALGFVYIASGFLASTTRKEDSQLMLFLSALAVVFLTIAVPLELSQRAITIAWAGEAAVLFALGIFLERTGLRFFGVGVLALALIRLFAYDSGTGDLLLFTPILNARFFVYLCTIAASGAMGYLATTKSMLLTEREKGMRGILWSIVNVLVVIVMTLEIVGFFDARIFILEQEQAEQTQRNTPRALQGIGGYDYNPYYDNYNVRSSPDYRKLVNQRNAAISVAWTLYAVLLITIGFVLRKVLVRWSALLLFGLTIGKVFIVDLSGLRTEYRIISFTVLGMILLLASFLYFRHQHTEEKTNI